METGYIKFADVETNKPIIEVKLVDGTVWMTINEIADLFGVYNPTINKQLKAIFKDNLLIESDVTNGSFYYGFMQSTNRDIGKTGKCL